MTFIEIHINGQLWYRQKLEDGMLSNHAGSEYIISYREKLISVSWSQYVKLHELIVQMCLERFMKEATLKIRLRGSLEFFLVFESLVKDIEISDAEMEAFELQIRKREVA